MTRLIVMSLLMMALPPVMARLDGAPGRAASAPAAGRNEVLEHHLRWRGGKEAFARLRDVRFAGTLATAGLTGPITTEETADGWSRVRYDLKVDSRTVVVGPEIGFAINASGQKEPLADGDLARRRFATLRALGRHLVAGTDVKVQQLPDEQKEGQRWNVLRFTHGADRFDLFVHPSDGSVTWTRETEDLETVWTRLEEWRAVGGVKFPHRERSIGTEESDNADMQWADIRVNTGIESKTLADVAAAPRLATLAGEGRRSGWIPMELHLGRWIYLKARVNGHETDVVLDSGAGATVIDGRFADRVGLRASGEAAARGVGGTQKASFVENLRIEVGAATFDRLRGVVIDLSGVESRMGRAMPVILGKEAFQELVVDVDYPRSRIAFHAPDHFVYEGPGRTIPLLAGEDGHRLVEASVEGLRPARFTLDTGSGGTVDFFDTFTQNHSLLRDRSPVSDARGGGVGGTIILKTATIRSFRFAGFDLTEVPVQFSSERKGAFASQEIAGNLGAAVFGRFRLVFDYSRERLHVEPGPDWDKKPFRKDRLGLSLDFDDGALVVRLVPRGSPALKAGWTIGERIVAIDGRKVDANTWAETVAQLRELAAGTEILFVDDTGRERRLIAADYY